MKSIAYHRPSRSQRNERAIQSQRVDELQSLVHRENMYHIASGHRVVNPRVFGDRIVVDTLYGNQVLLYTAGQFRNGYNAVVTI